MTPYLYGLAHFCTRRRWWVVAFWLAVTIAVFAISHGLGVNTSDDLSLPGTGSEHAKDTLQKSFPVQAYGTSPIVLHTKSGKLTDSKYKSAVNDAAADVAKAPYVASVVNPLTSQGASALSQGSEDGVFDGGAEGVSGVFVAEPGADDHQRRC